MRLLLVMLGAAIIVACGVHAQAPVAPVAPPAVRKIVFLADVPDSAVLCFYLTPRQTYAHPLEEQPLCRETVGALRERYALEQQARAD